MNITFWLNGVKRQAEVRSDELLLDFLRKNSCYSVKRGCETANCGLCTVLMDERPVLSCSMLAARADGKRIVTLEGMQEEAKEFGAFMANEGAEQCLQSGIYHECICHVKGTGRSYGRGYPGVSFRKSVPLLGICGTDQKYPEIS